SIVACDHLKRVTSFALIIEPAGEPYYASFCQRVGKIVPISSTYTATFVDLPYGLFGSSSTLMQPGSPRQKLVRAQGESVLVARLSRRSHQVPRPSYHSVCSARVLPPSYAR